MIIYKVTDRIPIIVGPVTFWVAPLSWSDKMEILSHYKLKAGEERLNHLEIAMRTIQLSLKKVDGLKYADGTDYELSLDENGNVTQESVSEIMQLSGSHHLVTVCGQFAVGEIKALELDGAKIDFSQVKTVKKKSSGLAVAQ